MIIMNTLQTKHNEIYEILELAPKGDKERKGFRLSCEGHRD